MYVFTKIKEGIGTMAKIDKYEKEIAKQMEKVKKLKEAKKKEESKMFVQIGELYVELQRKLDSEISFDEIIKQLNTEIDDFKSSDIKEFEKPAESSTE